MMNMADRQRAVDNATLSFVLAMEPITRAYDKAVAPFRKAFDEAWERSLWPTSETQWSDNLRALHRAYAAAKAANKLAYDTAWQRHHSAYVQELSKVYQQSTGE